MSITPDTDIHPGLSLSEETEEFLAEISDNDNPCGDSELARQDVDLTRSENSITAEEQGLLQMEEKVRNISHHYKLEI